MQTHLFFSIVVPAHNEERYIENTLEHIVALSYPVDKLETLVVENGSSDRTFELARRFESENLQVLQSERAISKARNAGIDHLSPQSDWVIFLDADTILEKEFLNELNAFLSTHKGFAAGAPTVSPLPATRKARTWFAIYNFWNNRITKTSWISIRFVKRSLFPQLRFDETMVNAEDLLLISEAKKFGKFFYMPTKTVSTSTRRLDTLGWWRTFFSWAFVGLLPVSLQRRTSYRVVR